jgi:UDP-N-acetylmuramyl pentapeptide synthase
LRALNAIRPAPDAYVGGDIQDGIDEPQIVHADVAALARQQVCDLLELFGCQLHGGKFPPSQA